VQIFIHKCCHGNRKMSLHRWGLSQILANLLKCVDCCLIELMLFWFQVSSVDRCVMLFMAVEDWCCLTVTTCSHACYSLWSCHQFECVTVNCTECLWTSFTHCERTVVTMTMKTFTPYAYKISLVTEYQKSLYFMIKSQVSCFLTHRVHCTWLTCSLQDRNLSTLPLW